MSIRLDTPLIDLHKHGIGKLSAQLSRKLALAVAANFSKSYPDDATVEDAMERLYFLAKIERGLEQSDGETIAHEEIKARFLK